MDAPEAEIKKAFKNLAMKTHPDRPGGSEEEFIKLSEAYELLVKREKREVITKNAFDQFREVYQGSSEEKEELIQLYNKYKGNMAKIVDHLLLGEDEQEARYQAIFAKEIAEGRLKEYAIYQKSLLKNARRQKKREKEAQEAAELAKLLDQSRASREDRWTRMIAKLEDQVAKKQK